ncbi:hypothetical protein [Stappia sp.]|uniref:hypothetical protein n=1 Tax=Stappia sp. TaxID=1870903 RepID=UPI003A99EFB1
MDRSIPMLLLGLFFGAGIGFTLAATNDVAIEGHDHSNPAHHGGTPQGGAHAAMSGGHGMHGHGEMLSLAAGPDAPALDITVTPDPASGWNLRIEARNFRFAPEHASGPHVDGEGHAHVHVNGEKVARHYGEWFHIAALPKGENTVEVSLNANDHRALAIDGKPLRAAQKVTVE